MESHGDLRVTPKTEDPSPQSPRLALRTGEKRGPHLAAMGETQTMATILIAFIYIVKNVVGPRPFDGHGVLLGWGGVCVHAHVNLRMK